ncbi:MAG: hypothetical protein COZ06_24215 [Armatimonadetes bacterium CG_4_10_14_3_um_filter_66_18]|nr:hypothetical protein [Armatimonadota bacterium]OIP04699.1 MAG: hypothetical protein AUJ96_12090 [Armatimonadetes bacterium CG2_30_66_41]PIU93237.1 MAG: hypothetical protein COS65_13720 [Armatimonadetes bacterium CG06_land_8_20_14_3_00_66_21]PIX48634.1 MAG: hypothetical protein COZ57_05115 [Armatimonadetes bacterium CG_4_8_14_3_um_filter_66_20]PIY42866.1 MAG: hypothetical protein COZ06_24215 [Armatimonadetes bacterium CG_4_10_14_3_um_filter_66_18]PIZ33823.1 MAG: hypothetical protein COY42_29
MSLALAADERDALIDSCARRIVGYGLETPAIFLLEMHKPLSFLGSQALLFASPCLAPFMGLERTEDFAALLNEPANVDLLLDRIEELAAVTAMPTGEPA